jgi:hypothetical protein
MQEQSFYYFHCQGLKSDENLMHRFHYFRWRELVNSMLKEDLPAYAATLDSFKQARNLHLFGTDVRESVKYRYQRQLVPKFDKYQAALHEYYPKILKEHMASGLERFEIIYRSGRPFLRIDQQDKSMKTYQPTEEDVNWDIDAFFKKVFQNDLPSTQ